MDGFQVNSPKPEKQGQYTSRKKGYSQLRARRFPIKRAQKREERLTSSSTRRCSVVRRVGILITFFVASRIFFIYCISTALYA